MKHDCGRIVQLRCIKLCRKIGLLDLLIEFVDGDDPTKGVGEGVGFPFLEKS